MDNPRPEKVAVVDEVRSRLESSSGALLTEYRGLKVSELAQLRRALRAAGGDYKIYKNTLVRLAVADQGVDGLETLLTGPTAIAFVDGDAAAVAKTLRDFARTNPNLVVKGGLLGGNLLSPAGAAALAELPSREVLLARLAGGLAAPLQQLAGLLSALPRNLAYGLKALIDQGGAPETAPAEPAPAEPVEEGTIEAAEAAAPRADAVSDAPAADAEATSTAPPVTDQTPPEDATTSEETRPTEASDGADQTEQ